MSDYYADMERAKALGLEYATNGIEAGQFRPDESPLSGEWSGTLTVADIYEQITGHAYPDVMDDDYGTIMSDLADYWEDGYNSAQWPVYGQIGQIVGYTYCSSEYSPAQWHEAYVERWIAGGVLSPAARDMAVEDILNQAAAYLGIDRDDEYSFDSDDFPKVILGE